MPSVLVHPGIRAAPSRDWLWALGAQQPGSRCSSCGDGGSAGSSNQVWSPCHQSARPDQTLGCSFGAGARPGTRLGTSHTGVLCIQSREGLMSLPGTSPAEAQQGLTRRAAVTQPEGSSCKVCKVCDLPRQDPVPVRAHSPLLPECENPEGCTAPGLHQEGRVGEKQSWGQWCSLGRKEGSLGSGGRILQGRGSRESWGGRVGAHLKASWVCRVWTGVDR